MNIVVFIKQVPDSRTVKFDREKGTLIRDGVEAVINPYDLHALEAGVRLKEAVGGEVTVVSMGPPQAQEAIRHAISLGADKGVLLSDRAFAGSDTLATTYILSKAVEKLGDYDLLLCGKLTTDGDTAQVGPGLAARLSIPYVTCVTNIEAMEGGLKTIRTFEDRSDHIEVPLPALLTCSLSLNQVRVPSLRGKMKAKKAEIPVWTAEDLGADPDKIGLNGSPTRVAETWVPSFDIKQQIMEEPPEVQARTVVKILKEAGIF